MYTSEGIKTKIFSKNELFNTYHAQAVIRQDGVVNEDSNAASSALSTFASVLGFFVTKLPTAVGVALSAVSLGASLAPSEKDVLRNTSINGEDFMENQYAWMLNNPQYDLIEIQYPYLKYHDVNSDGEDITFVSGNGIVKRVHSTSGGWIEF